MAQPIGGRFILGGAGGGGDDEHRRRDDTRGDDDHTDVAQKGWTSNCVRGYARFMLAVWAGRGAQAASCLVIIGPNGSSSSWTGPRLSSCNVSGTFVDSSLGS